jgi:hypothetical protein
VVVVVDPAEAVEALVPGKRGGLIGDPLLEVAVPAEDVDVEVEQLEAGGVVTGGEPLRGDRHPDAGRDPLAKRPGGRFHAGGPAVFRVPGALGVELAEALDVLEAHRGLADDLVVGVDRADARQVEQRVEQHRRVAVGQDEAIAVRPDRLLGVEPQEPLPEHVGDGRERHRRAGVP